MIKCIRKFLSLIMVAVVAVGICTSGFAAISNLQSTSTTVTEQELGMPDIGDYGTWTTENNKNLILNNIRQDVEKFSGTEQNQSTESYECDNTYVPLEAKVGLAFMNAFSHVAEILDDSLVRFTILFIVIMYGLWILFEAYTLIIGQNTVKEKVFEMAKVGAKVAIWAVVLSVGPAKMFLWVTSIIMEIGTMFANVVLEATTEIAGLNSETLCNTCDAIKEYAVKNFADNNNNNIFVTAREYIIDDQERIKSAAHDAANIMCVPTVLSGFCMYAIKLGWAWILGSIGDSMFGFLCGCACVVGFIYLAWKFAFIAFGVIADLFLGIIMLPFTAVAETVNKTTCKGIAGDMYNGFTKLFSAESLNAQIGRFVNVALHYVVLSIIIAICAALLSGILDMSPERIVPRFDGGLDNNFVEIALISALVWWLAKNATKFADEMGGKISYDMGTTLQNDAKTLWSKTKSGAKTVYKIIRKK